MAAIIKTNKGCVLRTTDGFYVNFVIQPGVNNTNRVYARKVAELESATTVCYRIGNALFTEIRAMVNANCYRIRVNITTTINIEIAS